MPRKARVTPLRNHSSTDLKRRVIYYNVKSDNDGRYLIGVTIGRIYSQHETYEFIDGEGLKAILVDGNKPQANALGAYLVNRNRPHLSGIHERSPKLILPNILRTCVFHLYRKFYSIAMIVPDEPMGRIRRSPYIKTQQEMDVFIQWCKDSEYKVVRDWITDKDSIPWFFPSFNQFLSKIPEDDWYLTPGNTNLNESAHPYTNQHTGTNLSLLEAIEKGYELDLQVEAKLREIEKSCVLVNHRNTKPQRDHNNAHAPNLRALMMPLSAPLRRRGQELREQQKALQSTSRVKKTKRRGEKAKERIPDADEFTGLVDDEGSPNSIQSPPNLNPALHIDNRGECSNHDVQLDPTLEPAFPPNYDELPYIELPGDFADYLL
ncbi:hypothetical protein B0H13DRAFT_2372459 [Mycena leptocephala]|nr:hypothetical protein B0H13DRAFT_2372459 [Mycena leptocephala]